MSQEEDKQLVLGAQAGDRRAMGLLVEKHYALMFKVAWKWCGNREDAEDIVQETAIKLAQHIDAFRFESGFTTWLYRMTINTAKDYSKARNRKNSRELPLFEDGVYISGEISAEEKLEQKEIVQALADLPVTLKETAILVFWQGLSHREAGAIMDVSEGTVSWRVHEARKKISEKLGLKKEGRRHG